MFWKFYAVARWLLTGLIAVTFLSVGWALVTLDYEPVQVDEYVYSSLPGSGYESGYENVPTGQHRYIDAVNNITDLIEENVTIINAQTSKMRTYETEYKIANACGTISVAIERWRPAGCVAPLGWQRFDDKFTEALLHFHRGADLLGRSNDAGYDEFEKGYVLYDEALAAAPEGAI